MSRRGAILQDYGGRFEPQPQDAQLAAANFYQRDKEQTNQLKIHQADQKKKDQSDASGYIGGLSVPHVGDNTIDLYNDAQILKLQNKLMDMSKKGATKSDIQLAAIPELAKISQGYTLAKNGYEKITNGLKDLTKDYPSGNMEAARNLAGNALVKDIFDFDEKGNIIGYKDPSLIPQDKNYLQDIESPDKLSQWYSPSGSLVKHIQTLPHTNLGESTKIRDKKGVERDNIWKGTGTVFSEVKRDENGKAIGMDIKSEIVPLGKNEDGTESTIAVLPKDEFNVMLGNKQAAADFTLQFYKHLKDLNVDPSKVDPRAMDYLQRQYARDWLKETGVEGSSFIPSVAEKQPLPPRVTINNKYGSDVPMMDIVTPVKDYFKENEGNVIRYTSKDGNVKTLGGVAQLNLFNNEVTTPIVAEVKSRNPNEELSADNIYYRNIDGDTWVVKAKSPRVINPETDIIQFKLDDFTNISGNKPQGQKSKNKALVEAEKKQKPTNETKPEIVEQNGYKYKLNKKTGKYEPMK